MRKGLKECFALISSNIFAEMGEPLGCEPCTDSFEALVTPWGQKNYFFSKKFAVIIMEK